MFLAIKELLYYKKKYLLVTTILILLIFMVLFLAGLANGLSRASGSIISDSKATNYVISDDADNQLNRSIITKEEFNKVKELNNSATPINLQRTTIQKENSSLKIDCTYLAIDPNSYMMVDIYKGKPLTDKNQIILSKSLLDEGINIGDIIKDTTTKTELTVVGFTYNESFSYSPIGVISLDTYQQFSKINTTTYQAIALNNNKLDKVKNISNLKVLSSAQITTNIPGHKEQQLTINMILIVLLLVSAMILAVFFYIITIQKLSQFATLKAIGTSMKKLSAMIIYQVLMIAGISVIIGDLITIAMGLVLPNKMPFTLPINQILLISLAFLLISIVSSLFTLKKVSKVDPIIAIGGGE